MPRFLSTMALHETGDTNLKPGRSNSYPQSVKLTRGSWLSISVIWAIIIGLGYAELITRGY